MKNSLYILYHSPFPLPNKNNLNWFRFVTKLNWQDYFQVKLAQLLKWHWHNCSQVKLAWLFPSDNGTTVPKRHWYNCSQVIHDCSQVRMAWLFLSDTDMIVPKWHLYNCFQVKLAGLFSFDFVICVLFCSLFFGKFFTSEFHMGTIMPCTRITAHDPSKLIAVQGRSRNLTRFKMELFATIVNS